MAEVTLRNRNSATWVKFSHLLAPLQLTYLSTILSRVYQYSPVLSVGGEQVGLYESEGGHSVAQYVGAPHQWDPVVEDDGGREPVEVLGVRIPQGMSDQPALQPIDLILVNQAYRIGRQHMGIMKRDTFVPIFKRLFSYILL